MKKKFFSVFLSFLCFAFTSKLFIDSKYLIINAERALESLNHLNIINDRNLAPTKSLLRYRGKILMGSCGLAICIRVLLKERNLLVVVALKVEIKIEISQFIAFFKTHRELRKLI